jgi:hypothetical protein
MRTYRSVATLNAVGGGFALIGVVFAIGGMTASGSYPLIPVLLVAVMGIVGVSLMHSAVLHLTSPSRKLALTNAANASIVIWFLLVWLLRELGLREVFGLAFVLVPLLLAFLAYRLFLRPAAHRAFPEDSKNA